MGIRIIKRNEYYELKKKRDKGYIKVLLLAAENGCYYVCDQSGMTGAKEIMEKQKKIKAEMKDQTKLL